MEGGICKERDGMKYNIGDRLRYFSVVGRCKVDGVNMLECICDCGSLFLHQVKHIGRKSGLTCRSNKKCSLWVDLNRKDIEWPDLSKVRYYDFIYALRGNNGMDKTCKTCKKKKIRSLFCQKMQQTCLSCLNGKTPEEFRVQGNQRSKKNRKGVIIKLVGSHENKRGFVYLMYSESINMYKVGKSKSPLARLDSVRIEYGLPDLKILCVGNPLGDAYKVENYIQNKIKNHKVGRLKPNGGFTNELFSCSLLIVSFIFIESMQEAVWLDDSTRDLIDINIPRISKEIISKRHNRKKNKAI